MEINNTLNGLVDALSKQLLDEVTAKVDAGLQDTIEKKLTALDIEKRVDVAAQSAAKVAAAQYEPNLASIDKQLAAATTAIINNITVTANKLVNEAIETHINKVNFEMLMSATLKSMLDQRVAEYDFPERSIKSSAIDYVDTFSGDNVHGGIIREFGSTGIDDKATTCRVTILDDHTVFENNLVANELTIKGTTHFEGELYIDGAIAETSPGFLTVVEASKRSVKADLNDDFFAGFSRIIYDRIHQDGIDLSRVTLNGAEIIVGSSLGMGITESNLKTVGVLNELQVAGESLLDNTLYVTNRRVGINTLEPSSALSLWDEEVDIQIGKKQQNMMSIGSNRDQTISLGTNGKTNLLLNTDGSVSTSKLTLGTMTFSSAGAPPNYDAPKGTVVFNQNPSIGGPLGWVSLGQTRWANFGIIE